jgi:hypothetical protein
MNKTRPTPQWHNLLSNWALINISLLIILAASGCKGKQNGLPAEIAQGECSEASEANGLSDLIPKACKAPKDAPMLYAQNLSQTPFKESLLFELFSEKDATMCPPGPYLLGQNPVSTLPETQWRLLKSPDFFVWHLNTNADIRSSIYLTDQSGMPVKAKGLRLAKDKTSTLILLPDAPLKPEKPYYLYLEINDKDKKRWIQPLITVSQLDNENEN